ncbi:MAG: hypothetical protein LUG96_08730 [Tannerellaceae bacterium]|nr:hypothetical protein [Tannerellaceae bacterium]
MLENVLNLIKSHAMDAINNNPEIPEDKKAQTVETTTQAVTDGLKQNLNMSNLTNLKNMLSGGTASATSNPIVDSIKNTVINALVQKVGLSQGIASTLSSTIVPSIFSAFASKAGQANGGQGLDLGSIMSQLGSSNGDNQEGLLGALGKFLH